MPQTRWLQCSQDLLQAGPLSISVPEIPPPQARTQLRETSVSVCCSCCFSRQSDAQSRRPQPTPASLCVPSMGVASFGLVCFSGTGASLYPELSTFPL